MKCYRTAKNNGTEGRKEHVA